MEEEMRIADQPPHTSLASHLLNPSLHPPSQRYPPPRTPSPPNPRVSLANHAPQFALSFFLLLDASIYSASSLNGTRVHHTFIDWLPLIFSALGMLIINSIEKSRLSADSFSYSGSGVAWKARVVLFLGFAALAGGVAGGVAVCVLKYVVPAYRGMTLWMGVSNVIANGGVMLRYVSRAPSAAPNVFMCEEGRCGGGCFLLGTSADGGVARSFSGFRRTWRTSTRTTWRYNGIEQQQQQRQWIR